MTLKVIRRLQDFSSAIRRTFVHYFTKFQLTVCARAVPQRQLGFLLMCVTDMKLDVCYILSYSDDIVTHGVAFDL